MLPAIPGRCPGAWVLTLRFGMCHDPGYAAHAAIA